MSTHSPKHLAYTPARYAVWGMTAPRVFHIVDLDERNRSVWEVPDVNPE